jgi:deoxycytidylate deaminase
MEFAKTASLRSNCIRKQVGAVIVDNDNRILATGYNGSPSGVISCVEKGYCYRIQNNIPSGEQYEACLAGDTVIKLLDGTYKTIKELADTQQSFWVYAVDTETYHIVPALAINPRLTGIRRDIYKITFDNNKSIKCTSDHKILMRDGSYKQAKDIKVNDSVMPMYYNFKVSGKEKVSNGIKARKEKWGKDWVVGTCGKQTHHLVYEYFNGEIDITQDYCIHHRDENKLNNIPNNLEYLLRSSYTKYHGNFDKLTPEQRTINAKKGVEKQRQLLQEDEQFRKRKSDVSRINIQTNWNDSEFVKRHIERSRVSDQITAAQTNSDPEIIRLRSIGRVLAGLNDLIHRTPFEITECNYKCARDSYKTLGRKGRRTLKVETILKYFDSIGEALEQAKLYNHKVIGIEKLNKSIEVYDLTVPQFENFAIDLGDNSCVFVHNCSSLHAEMNAIIQIGRKLCKGSSIYVWGHSFVCSMCKRFIINAGIENIYLKENDNSEFMHFTKDDFINDFNKCIAKKNTCKNCNVVYEYCVRCDFSSGRYWYFNSYCSEECEDNAKQ